MIEKPYRNLTDRQYLIKRFIEAHEPINPLPTVEEIEELRPLAKEISDRFFFACCSPDQHKIDLWARMVRQ